MKQPSLTIPSIVILSGLLWLICGTALSQESPADITDPEAQYQLGMRYGQGNEVARDDQLARQWLERAATKDHIPAQYALGWLYYSGRGVAQDYSKATALFRQAAEADNADAQYMMGIVYAQGHGVPKDSKASIRWTRRAAAQGHPRAKKLLTDLFGPQAKKLLPGDQ